MSVRRENLRADSSSRAYRPEQERSRDLFVVRNLQSPNEDDDNALLNQAEIKDLAELGFVNYPRVFVLPAEIGKIIIGRQSGGFEASSKIMKKTMDSDRKLFVPRMPLPGSDNRKPEVETDVANVVRSFDPRTKTHRISIRPDGITQGRIYLQSEALMKASGITGHLDIQPPEDPLVVIHEGRNKAAAEKSTLNLWRMINRHKADNPDIPLTFVLGAAKIRY